MGVNLAGRYEEGYISSDGIWVTVSNVWWPDSGWSSPGEAVHEWAKRGDFGDATVVPYGNGKLQILDVGERSEFIALGVVKIWRRITFGDAKEFPPNPTAQVSSPDVGPQGS